MMFLMIMIKNRSFSKFLVPRSVLEHLTADFGLEIQFKPIGVGFKSPGANLGLYKRFLDTRIDFKQLGANFCLCNRVLASGNEFWSLESIFGLLE